MFASRLQGGYLVEFVHRTVDAHACKALSGEFANQLCMFSFAIVDQRGQQQCRLLGAGLEYLIDHLTYALRGQINAVDRAARQPGACIQQAQVIIDLGDRTYGGAWIVGSGLLLDGYGRREALDAIDVRLIHHGQELACVSGQRLHVTALALGVQRVKGQGRFAGSGQSREHDQLVPR